MRTYWGVSAGSARAGMGAYLISLRWATRRPHKLHDGHKYGDDETADQHHKDAPNVLHAQTWEERAWDTSALQDHNSRDVSTNHCELKCHQPYETFCLFYVQKL